MVQITTARIGFNEETGEPILLPAREYDKALHGHLTCHCPDPKCHATLIRHATHERIHYFGGEAYRVKIADYYQREAKSPYHDASCTAVKQYESYQSYARDRGAISLGEGAMIFNLNILSDNIPAPLRQRAPILRADFSHASAPADDVTAKKEKRALSKGINSTKKLARMIEETGFNTDYRASILMRIGRRQYTLAEIYHENPVQFFRDRHAKAKSGMGGDPALVQFKPIAIAAKRDSNGKISGKFHDKVARTIQGQAIEVPGKDGQNYYVSMKLHCGNDDIYKTIKDAIKEHTRSFMIYSERSYVDLDELVNKKLEIAKNPRADKAVFVHIHVDRAEQLYIRKPAPIVKAPVYAWGQNPDEPVFNLGGGPTK